MPPAGAVVANKGKHGHKGSGEGAAEEWQPTELAVDRLEFVALLKRRLQRARRFRTLPLAVALFCLYIAAILSRSGLMSDAHDFDRSLLLAVWGTDSNLGYPQPSTLPGYLAYIGASVPPDADSLLYRAFLAGTALGGAAASYGAQGSIPGTGFVLGGAVLTQTRWAAPTPCPPGLGPSNLSAFWPAQFEACTATGGLSPAFPPATTAALPPELAPAFLPALPPSPPPYATPALAAHLSAYADFSNATQPYLAALLGAGWVDEATHSLTLSAAFVNLQLGRIAHARYSISGSRGGLPTVSWRLRSVLLDPYGAGAGGGGGEGRPPYLPGLTTGLDVAVLIYLVYIVSGTLKRCARATCGAADASQCCSSGCCCGGGLCGCCGGGGSRRGQQGSRRGSGGAAFSSAPSMPPRHLAALLQRRGDMVPPALLGAHAPRPSFCSALLTLMPLESLLLDAFSCGSLTATAVLWAAHTQDLAGLSAALTLLPPLAPVDESVFPPLPGPGSTPALLGGAPPWAGPTAWAGAAVDSFTRWQTAAVLALLGLALQVVKYASFQSHLGVLFGTFARSARDMYHFAWLLLLCLAVFVVWAQLLYGHHMSQWSGGSVEESTTAVFRFMMYDYDIAAMRGADETGLTGLFYILFMMMVTNIMLWLFFAVLFDSYSEARAKAAHWPSFGAELTAFTASIPYMLPSLPDCCCTRTLYCRRVSVFGLGGRSIVPWGALLHSATGSGPLAHSKTITPELLTTVHGLTSHAAALLVADCAGAVAARGRALKLEVEVAEQARSGGGAVVQLERARAQAEFYGLAVAGGEGLPAGALELVRRQEAVAGEPGGGAGSSGGKGRGQQQQQQQQQVEVDSYEAENPAVFARLGRMLQGALPGGGGGSGGAAAAAAASPREQQWPEESSHSHSHSQDTGGRAEEGHTAVNPLAAAGVWAAQQQQQGAAAAAPQQQAAAAATAAEAQAVSAAAAGGQGAFHAWDVMPAPELSAYEAEGLSVLPRVGGKLEGVAEEEGEGEEQEQAGGRAGARNQWVEKRTQGGEVFYANVGGWLPSVWDLPAGGVVVGREFI